MQQRSCVSSMLPYSFVVLSLKFDLIAVLARFDITVDNRCDSAASHTLPLENFQSLQKNLRYGWIFNIADSISDKLRTFKAIELSPYRNNDGLNVTTEYNTCCKQLNALLLCSLLCFPACVSCFLQQRAEIFGRRRFG